MREEVVIPIDFTKFTAAQEGVQIWTTTGTIFIGMEGMRASGCCVASSWMSCDIGVRNAHTWEVWRESVC